MVTMAGASPVPLSGQEVKGLVAGATVEIDAPMGYKIPVRYAPDGTVTGQAGGLASYLGAPTDIGRWWVSGDYLCHKWSVWFERELQCLRLSREGRTIHWEKKDGSKGTASIAIAAPPIQSAIQEAAPAQSAPRRPEVVARLVPAPSARQEASGPPAPDRADLPEPVPQRALPEARVERKPPPPSPPAESKRVAERQPMEPPRAAVPTPVPVTKVPTARAAAATRIGPLELMVVNVRANDVLNVRSGPSADADIVGELPPGSRGIELMGECQTDWCPVQHYSARGWVHRNYIASSDRESGAAPGFVGRADRASESDFPRRGPSDR